MAPLVCFVAGSFFVNQWSARIDDATESIAGNGGPGVVYLAHAQEHLRRIERRALLTTPASLAEERAAIAVLTSEYDRTVALYRTTPDYPGELRAFLEMQHASELFFGDVDRLLAAVARGKGEDVELRARLRASADVLAARASDLVQLNAQQVMVADETIIALRRRVVWLGNARDLLAVLFAVGGAMMALRAARAQVIVAEERGRLDEERAAELELFAGRVAHDLRNPLAAIQMRCMLAEKARTGEAAVDALARITHQVQRMAGIIDALLAFARAGARVEPGVRCEVGAVVREIIAEAQPVADGAGVELVVEPMPAATVACDASVLAVVLSNLTRNAIKFIGDGCEGVRRVVLRGAVEETWLRLDVEDTGPGLVPGAEARVFEPFVRLGATRAAGDGIGLGLATVKRLVEPNGGQVGVESRPGLGCRFWVTLVRSS